MWDHDRLMDPTDSAAADPVPPAVLDIEGYLTDPTAELRRCAAASWWAQAIDEQGAPLPIVLDHDHVRATLRDRTLSPRSFTDDMIAAGVSEQTAHQLTPLFRRHGDEHQAFRGLLAAAFTPRRVERLRPSAAAIADRLAAAIAAAGGRCEFVADFATPLPPELFAELFGLPAADRDRLAHWAAVVTTAFVPPLSPEQVAQVEAAATELREWCAGLIAQRRAEPTDDLVTRLLQAEVDGRRLDDVDITAVITGFVFAGAETTKRQLTQLIVAFAAHPDAWRRLADAPELVPNAVEEVMRFRPIVPGLSRVAVEPCTREGLHVEPGQRVVVSIDTANHDAAVFADPDTFAIDRPGADAHLTFGWGPHFCVGAGLARVEMQEALRALVARFDAPVLDAIDPAAVPAGFSGPDALPVTFPLRADRGPART